MQKPEPFVKPDTVFSVTDAAALLKGVVETAFPCIRIRGELSQITRASSGHMYMTIKDAGAAISAIIWRGTPLNFKLEDGLEVIITGRLTTYPARSNYQIIVNEIEMAGVGAILKMLEARKQKLAAEGLFDAARKKPLPKLPRCGGCNQSHGRRIPRYSKQAARTLSRPCDFISGNGPRYDGRGRSGGGDRIF